MCNADWQTVNASEAYTYTLPKDEADLIYPNNGWLPEPYQKYYQGLLVEDVIKLFTENSLRRDGIAFDSVAVNTDLNTSAYVITINSDDPNTAFYQVVHPQFIANYNAALQGVDKCKQLPGCWNKNNPHLDEPWATAIAYCEKNDNNPCATCACPTNTFGY